MPCAWEGGREGLYAHPKDDPDSDSDSDSSRLIEVVAYGANLQAKGRAVYQVVVSYEDGCPDSGYVAEAFPLAFSPAALGGSVHARVNESCKEWDPAASVLLHFCEGRREDCHVVCSHRTMLHIDKFRVFVADGRCETWEERFADQEADLFVTIPWAEALRQQITEKLEWIRRFRFKDKPHETEWDSRGAEAAFVACEQKEKERLALKRAAKESKWSARDNVLSTLCRCGRPPANCEGDASWCLLCSKPSGDEHEDARGTTPFGSEEITPEHASDPDLVWSLETGSWKLVKRGVCENEYTRALRRKPLFSREYVNAYLYLQRVGEKAWLQKFDELEEWLDKHPGDLPSLPKYPSAHAKNKEERRVGQFIMWASLPCVRYLDVNDGLRETKVRALELAQYMLLSSLDGWSVQVTSRREHIVGRCANRWAVMWEEMDAWFLEHGRPPLQTSSDKMEKRLAMWWKEQWKMQKRGKLQENREELLEEFSSAWLKGRWQRSFEETEQWYANHPGREPARRARDAKEKCVARFISNQRSRQKELSAAQLQKLQSTKWWKPQICKRPAIDIGSSVEVKKRPARQHR